ncbi:electron transfer flavoprotein subunit alpha [Atribacter laminatus]|uniref:Caffeyl-CoA reductase-Etf complex subunit CarE n=1 Tax=Atribacter laminatus TaxID=2847778 RepID=A0A7T1F246_ATRLM|nr:electron transfer flavoprotein subunit alpha [Atribacter laminatus]QPM67643.1 Caffeyl-CoA reductase-Etf complex subunit CarE [Atribacter laminatus]
MAELVINHNRCNLCGKCITVCPFNAISMHGGKIEISAGCKMCKLCSKNCPEQAIDFIDKKRTVVNKEEWKGILVFVENFEGNIHPVTFELIGKANEIAKSINHPIYCLIIGDQISHQTNKLLKYPVNKVFLYEDKELKHFRVDTYTNIFEDCIRTVKPSVILVGATLIGRSLAPRVAARFRTGLTADCTSLEVRENTDLVQIRPAFGGNIMAQIITPYSRPQIATVRHKVMTPTKQADFPLGKVERCFVTPEKLNSKITIRKVMIKEELPSISDVEVLIAAGRGVRGLKDLSLFEELATLLGGQLATTRPLVEMGWVHYSKQIGLSGRTVKPKLIITCGISGAVQFMAGMSASECIIAINKDRNAPIFGQAHYAVIGDIYEVVPLLIEKIKKTRDTNGI